MYQVTKRWKIGYVILPCFTVRELIGTHDVELTCGPVLEWIFIHFFAPFWKGKVWFIGEFEE